MTTSLAPRLLGRLDPRDKLDPPLQRRDGFLVVVVVVSVILTSLLSHLEDLPCDDCGWFLSGP